MAYKTQAVKTTVSAAVGNGFSEIQSLAEEMREGCDNMKGQRYGEAADELEGHEEIDVPEFLADLEVVTSEQVNKDKRRGPSRSVRLDNAQALLCGARDAVQAWLADEGITKEEGQEDEAESFISDLDEHCEFDVDFPGMFG